MKRLSVIIMVYLLSDSHLSAAHPRYRIKRTKGGSRLSTAPPKSLDNWNRVGDANWRAEDGAVVADKGKGGHLVSKNSYKDFQISAEFWADHTTNSGIFIRISDPKKIGAESGYEANIYDQRPEPNFGTGAIVECRQGVADAQGRRQMEHL